jgi:Protein of unknown function/Domain of unknown function (DUF1835)
MIADPNASSSQIVKSRKTLNIGFSDNAGVAIRALLNNDSHNEDIEIVSGGFHLGPIDNDDIRVRHKWLRDHIDPDFNENIIPATSDLIAAFITSHKDDSCVFAWVDLMSAEEYANFLYWVDRFKPSNFFIVQPKLNSDKDAASSLRSARDGARLTSSEELNEYAVLWNRLKLEDGAFRLFSKAGELRSSTVDAFDDILVDSVTAEWTSMPEIVLKAMNICWASGKSIPGDLFFYRRLIWLSNYSEIERRGDPNEFSKMDLRFGRQLE